MGNHFPCPFIIKMENKAVFKWEDIRVQFNEEQQKEMEHIIWMAKSTGEPQKAILGDTGISFAVFSTGLIYKIEEEENA